MANFAFALPYVPPAPPVSPWQGIRLSWRGWDGSEWDLTSPKTGLFLQPGVRGLHLPPIERHTDTSPAVAGSRYLGHSTLEREVFFPLYIYSDDGSAEFIERDRAFWKTMDPARPGTLTATIPGGGRRTLSLRLQESDDDSTHDPIRRGWAKYGITLVAEQPFWEGDPVVRSWKAAATAPFFEPDGPQIVNLASGADVSNATIDNPGDVESYPRWFVDGDAPGAAVGVDGVTVEVPFAVAEGTCLVVDSDPDNIGATLYDVAPEELTKPPEERKKPSERVVGVDLINPVDKSPDLGEADFAPVPAGASVPLSLSITGTGTIEILLPTRYRRAL